MAGKRTVPLLAIVALLGLSGGSCSRESPSPSVGAPKARGDHSSVEKAGGEAAAVDFERVELPWCFDWVALSNVQLLEAARLMERSLQESPRDNDEFGPWPAVESCCDLENARPGELPEKQFCTLAEYARDSNGWEAIGFVVDHASPFTYFATLSPEEFEASTWADLNCDGEPEFYVKLVVPREGNSLKLEQRLWRLSANAQVCLESE